MSWEKHKEAWSHPPIDGVGYLSSRELLQLSDNKLKSLIEEMRITRYQGERNTGNRWRDVMGLDDLHSQDILDFGCGVGIESLELGLSDNEISLADIVDDNLRLAERVLKLFGLKANKTYSVINSYPFIDAPHKSLDVFYCNGVLHHCEWPREIMERAHELLRDKGEARLMLYSDIGWQIATGVNPPPDVKQHPLFRKFVRYFDSVGEYADWYNADRIIERFGDLFTLERCEYLTFNDRYIGAVLRKRKS